MCHLRLHDYPTCTHSFLKPIFCSRALNSANPDQFCRLIRTSSQKLVSFTTWCPHCIFVNQLVLIVATSPPPQTDARTGKPDVTRLNKMVADMTRQVERTEGTLVNSLNEADDRGLGELVRFDARWMLPAKTPEARARGKKATVGFVEEVRVIGEDGGAEWAVDQDQGQDSQVGEFKSDADTDIGTVFQPPKNLRFIELTRAQVWAWWRDRQALRKNLDGANSDAQNPENPETLEALIHFWASLRGARETNGTDWKLQRLLGWVSDSDQAAGYSMNESPSPPSTYESSGSGEEGVGSAAAEVQREALGQGKLGPCDSISQTPFDMSDVAGWLALAKLREPGMERTEFYSDGETVADGMETKVFQVEASTGEILSWQVHR